MFCIECSLLQWVNEDDAARCPQCTALQVELVQAVAARPPEVPRHPRPLRPGARTPPPWPEYE